jgi:hypothetical protein
MTTLFENTNHPTEKKAVTNQTGRWQAPSGVRITPREGEQTLEASSEHKISPFGIDSQRER